MGLSKGPQYYKHQGHLHFTIQNYKYLIVSIFAFNYTGLCSKKSTFQEFKFEKKNIYLTYCLVWHLVCCMSQCQMGGRLHLTCVSPSSGGFSRSDTILHFTSTSSAWQRNPAWIQDGISVTTTGFRYVRLSVKCLRKW